MKNMKKLAAIIAAMIILGSAGAVYAATVKTPAEIAAAVTGKTVDEVNAQRTAGETYGAIANEAGKLDEFKAQMLEQKKAVLDQRVKDGKLTQEQADEIYNAIKNNQANCNGTGSSQIGRRHSAGFGSANGTGRGIGGRMGNGAGMGGGVCGGYLNR